MESTIWNLQSTTMKVESKVHIYQIDGKDTVIGDEKFLNVRNVWNKDRFVEIQISNGEKVIVHEGDLLKAISNATRNERR